jgi:hypothetical protein
VNYEFGIICEGEYLNMKLSKKDLELIAPRENIPASEEEYLKMLRFDNNSIDYGKVMDYDPEEQRQIKEYLKQLMNA